MDVSTSSVSFNSQTMGYSSSQVTNTSAESPVQRLEAARGMDSPAMKEMLAASIDRPVSGPTNVSFNAQAQIVNSQENVTGSIVDIIV